MSYQVRNAYRAARKDNPRINQIVERDEVFSSESHHAAGGHGFTTVGALQAFCDVNSVQLDYASEYGEPGYTHSDKGILFSNWNDVPNKIQDRLEAQGYALEWSDEWYIDGGRSPVKAYRTSPDSHGWESRLMMIDGDYLTPDDDLSEWIEQAKDNPRTALPSWWSEEDINKLGWIRTSERFEAGFHPGQNDDPVKIAKRLEDADESYVFQITSTGQFDINFAVYLNRYSGGFERLSLELKPDDALSGSQPGQNADDDIADLRKVPYIARQLEALDPEQVRAELNEWGAWDETELADDDANLNRVLWTACCNVREEVRS